MALSEVVERFLQSPSLGWGWGSRGNPPMISYPETTFFHTENSPLFCRKITKMFKKRIFLQKVPGVRQWVKGLTELILRGLCRGQGCHFPYLHNTKMRISLKPKKIFQKGKRHSSLL